MCPFMLMTFFFTLLLMVFEMAAAMVTFNTNATMPMSENKVADFQFTLSNPSLGGYHVEVDHPDIADIAGNNYFNITKDALQEVNGSTRYVGDFQVRANFLGYSQVTLYNENGTAMGQYKVSVKREQAIISTIFVISVAIVVSISYINMGCALDIDAVYEVLRRPIAPGIGFFAQYFCMPLLSFGLGWLFFDQAYLRLGLFIFGCSPGGGASNMWAVLLQGNLNLSITMTFLSTLLSFGMMPFWLYTLGRTIFEDTATQPPVRSILTTLGTMVIFLGIGLIVKRFLPRMANVCRRILAPFSGIMIIFIVIFGTYANWYMFKVMTWQMFLATALNVYAGMLVGFVLAYFFKKPLEDMIAIAIETGVQNTGVSFVVLGVSLVKPDSDIASAVPVAASIMTPIPLTIAWCIIRLRRCLAERRAKPLSKLYVDAEYQCCKSASQECNLTASLTSPGGISDNSQTNSTRSSNTTLVKTVS